MNNNNIFFRVNDELYYKLNKIKTDYKFRSNAELVKIITKVFCDLYYNKQPKEESIEEMFRELENGDFQFDYTKPKKVKKQCEIYDFE